MTRFRKKTGLFFVIFLTLVFGICMNAYAMSPVFTDLNYNYTEFSNAFESYNCLDLNWCDSADDNNSGSTSLGFSVNIGGASYDYFDINSNGYVEMLQGSSDVPTNYGPGFVNDLVNADTSSTYLLGAYDDLSSASQEYYGYKLFADRAVFYYFTETWADEGEDIREHYQIILSDNGNVQWNFKRDEHWDNDYDMYSGLYFGNTETLHELARDGFPNYTSYVYTPAVVPEPISSTLFLIGGATLGFRRMRKRV